MYKSSRTWAEGRQFGDNDRGADRVRSRLFTGAGSGRWKRFRLVTVHRLGQGGGAISAIVFRPSRSTGDENSGGGNGETHLGGSLSGMPLF